MVPKRMIDSSRCDVSKPPNLEAVVDLFAGVRLQASCQDSDCLAIASSAHKHFHRNDGWAVSVGCCECAGAKRG